MPTINAMFQLPQSKRIALAFIAALLPLLAAAAPAYGQASERQSDEAMAIEGTWDFRVDGTTIFRFAIEQGSDGEWLGEWQRPEVFNTDGNAFANMGGGVKTSASMTGIEFLGQVELSFDDPRPGAVPDIFRFDLTGEDSASMLYVGTDLAPYRLVRAGDDDPIGDWDTSRIYRRQLSAAEPEEEQPVPLLSPRRPTINFIDITPADNASAEPEIDVAEVAEAETEAAPDDAAPEETPPEEAEEPASLIGDDFLDGL